MSRCRTTNRFAYSWASPWNRHGADGMTFKLKRDPRVTPFGSSSHYGGRHLFIVMVGLDPTNSGDLRRVEIASFFGGTPLACVGRVKPDHDGYAEQNGKMRTAAPSAAGWWGWTLQWYNGTWSATDRGD